MFSVRRWHNYDMATEIRSTSAIRKHGTMLHACSTEVVSPLSSSSKTRVHFQSMF